MIDKSGEWWTGEGVADLLEYVVQFSSQNYVADHIRQSVCAVCNGTQFLMWVDDDEGCAKRVCHECGSEAYIADSEEYWDDASPEDVACPCGNQVLEVAVGFSRLPSGEVGWVTVGGRCISCGVLGVYVDWKIDYEPSQHLLDMV